MKRDGSVNWNNRLTKIRAAISELNAAAEDVYRRAEKDATAEVWTAVERFHVAARKAESIFWGAIHAELD